MGTCNEIRLAWPDCWSSCGNCAAGEVVVQSVFVAPGEMVAEYGTVIVVETAKTALEIPSPWSGRIIEVCVLQGSALKDGELIALVEVV